MPTWTLSELLQPCSAIVPVHGVWRDCMRTWGYRDLTLLLWSGKSWENPGKSWENSGNKGKLPAAATGEQSRYKYPTRVPPLEELYSCGGIIKNGCSRSYPTITIQPTSLYRNAKRCFPSQQNGAINLETNPFMDPPAPALPHWPELQGGHSAQEVTSNPWVPPFPSLEKSRPRAGSWTVLPLLSLSWPVSSLNELQQELDLWSVAFVQYEDTNSLSCRKTGAQTCHRERLWEISSKKNKKGCFKNLVPDGLNAVILPLQEKEVSKTHLIHWQHSI